MSDPNTISAMTLSLTLPDGAYVPFVVPVPPAGFSALLNYRFDLGGVLAGISPNLATFPAISTITLPSAVTRVQSSGAVSVSDGGEASYILDSTQGPVSAKAILVVYYGEQNGLSASAAQAAAATVEIRIRRQDLAARWFIIGQREISAEAFRLVTDTDATWAQAVCDYNAYWQGAVQFGTGNYTITNSIQVARGILVDGGASYTPGNFIGAGSGFLNDPNFGGTQFTLTAKDRPAIVVQAGRHNELREFGLLGQLATYIESNALGTQTSSLDESVAANWDGNGISEMRYAPYAGIAVDPRSDSDPGGGQGYPDFGDPAWGGAVQTSYGRALTSLVKILDVDIRGFNVGIVVHPSPGELQSDFVTYSHSQLVSSKWGFSVGNTQSRQTTIQNIEFNQIFCCLTNCNHGEEHGQFGCTVIDTSFGACIKWFDFRVQYTGGVTFLDCYGEQGLLIGDLRNGSAVDPPISFKGGSCDFLLAASAKTGVYPYLIGEPTLLFYSTGQVQFSAFQISVQDVAPLMATNLDLDGLQIQAVAAESNMVTYARSLAQNGTLGLVGPIGGLRAGAQRVRGLTVNLSTFDPVGFTWTDNTNRTTNRASCLPYWIRQAIPASATDDNYAVKVPGFSFGTTKGSITGLSITDGVMTGTWAGITADIGYYLTAIAPGRVFMDSTGSWWYMAAFNYSTGAFTANILSGWRKPASTKVLYVPVATGGGSTFTFYQTGFFTPSKVLYGTLTSGSNVIASLQAPDGSTSWLTGEFAAGDYLYIDPNDPAPAFTVSAYGNKLTAFDAAAKTMTMNGNALKSGAVRLEMFIRGPN